MSTPDVITRLDGGVGRISLNRPAALHALNHAMTEAIVAALAEWREDPAVSVIILDHAGERGFCAGGDIRVLADSGYGDGMAAHAFFRTEYQLNHFLFHYPKPIVAFMDGVVMGGGVGLALPCRFRVTTERTNFAMPETGIGLFPDVGGGWHLPRLPRRAGWWLGLTGARLKAADCGLLGISNHHLASGEIEAVKRAICGAPDAVEAILASAATSAGDPSLAEHLDEIEQAFAAPTLEAAIARLGEGTDWGRSQAALLAAKSPQSLKVTWRLMTEGAGLTDFADEMSTELRVASRIVRSHDFLQGVRAVILVKDGEPRWYPPTLADVSDAAIERIFAKLPPELEWSSNTSGGRI